MNANETQHRKSRDSSGESHDSASATRQTWACSTCGREFLTPDAKNGHEAAHTDDTTEVVADGGQEANR